MKKKNTVTERRVTNRCVSTFECSSKLSKCNVHALSNKTLSVVMTFHWPGLYLSDFHCGWVRVSTGYHWPSDYSRYGGCQIGKLRIVVHKYTGLARKWNPGVVRGFRVNPPKTFCRTFWGVNYLLRGGVKPTWPPIKYSPVIGVSINRTQVKLRWKVNIDNINVSSRSTRARVVRKQQGVQ